MIGHFMTPITQLDVYLCAHERHANKIIYGRSNGGFKKESHYR